MDHSMKDKKTKTSDNEPLCFLSSSSHFLDRNLGTRRGFPFSNRLPLWTSTPAQHKRHQLDNATLVSSFMAADTISSVFLVSAHRAATVLLSLWLGALTISILETDFLSLVGLLHCLIFLGCAGRVFFGNFGSHEKDYIRVPLQVCVPFYTILWIASMLQKHQKRRKMSTNKKHLEQSVLLRMDHWPQKNAGIDSSTLCIPTFCLLIIAVLKKKNIYITSLTYPHFFQKMAARNIMESIKIQSDDLREELKELDMWEDEMAAKQAARKNIKPAASSTLVEPPIRGTVPSIKEAVTKASDEKKKNAGPDPVQIAKEKGNEYFRLNKIGDAIEAYTKGIESDPSSSAMYILYANRAMCYLKRGDWEKAEKDASVSMAMNTAYPKAYYRRAMARKELGKLKEARTDLEAVLALAPTDASAKTELEAVTKMLQMERAKQEASEKSRVAKKIVIEEVDDDEEDEEDSAEDERAYQERLKAQEEEVKRREREAEEARRQIIEEEKRKTALKKSDRVEVVEEVVPPVTRKKPSTGAPSTPAGAAAPVSSTAAAAAPAAAPPRKLPTARPTKESLKAPKSYTEFERVFTSVEKDEELRNHYVSLLNPSTLRSLLGSNLTPELLHGILESAKGQSPTDAFELLKGLSAVNRIEDITSFFSDDEVVLMDQVLKHIKESGAPAGEIDRISKKMKPFG
eukprot:gene10286-7189_t